MANFNSFIKRGRINNDLHLSYHKIIKITLEIISNYQPNIHNVKFGLIFQEILNLYVLIMAVLFKPIHRIKDLDCILAIDLLCLIEFITSRN
jgi:hypothetical protein